ncbi:lytic murein transglycosylase [Pararhizobium mangrovi]|uniref:Lytic murein transglycosylase n=1 Tax=Pararhizobium mangrovi TaxID=2590452 RepID=A0A506UAE5_9HYPH|nr:lytic murein transglycosylase [Pararhizobium mangrovi]TPW30336.1 lytic murein transglycosylase [Pararhizobium mangrovi]
MHRKLALLALTTSLVGAPILAHAQQAACGGSVSSFRNGVEREAEADGVPASAARQALSHANISQHVLSMDRGQSVFKQTFLQFSQRAVSSSRLQRGKQKLQRYASTFQKAERRYGVPGPVITAFWGLESDYGAVQGDFNTLDALFTMAHDCRRPDLFRPQLIAAVEMAAKGDLDPTSTTGAWAGEIGQVQMLPKDIIDYGIDGNGNGHVRLKTDEEDVIMTAANYINALGWRRNEPWLQEVEIPNNLPWQKTGLHKSGMTVADWQRLGVHARSGSLPDPRLSANLIMPQGRHGPTFLAYPNFNVYLEWNKSFIYTTTAAYFATRLAGAPPYDHSNPSDGLSDAQMKQLQQILKRKGYDVGEVDGILGAGTRDAVRQEEQRLGLPADGWPTRELLAKLQ